MNVILSTEEVQSFIVFHNPLLVRDEYGKLKYYDNMIDCYCDFMYTIYVRFAKGYCDPVLWLHETFGFYLKDAEQIFRNWRMKFNSPNEPFMIAWSDIVQARKYLRFFMQGVLNLVGGSLKEDIFNIAFDRFFKEYNLKDHLQ